MGLDAPGEQVHIDLISGLKMEIPVEAEGQQRDGMRRTRNTSAPADILNPQMELIILLDKPA